MDGFGPKIVLKWPKKKPIYLLLFLEIPLLMRRPSVCKRSPGRPSVRGREKSRCEDVALHSPHYARPVPEFLSFFCSLITLISWSRPHKKQMSTGLKGKSVFRKELNSWRCQCFDLADKASRQLLKTRGCENVKQQAATPTFHAA